MTREIDLDSHAECIDPLWRLVWIDADNDLSDADDFDRFRCLTYPSPGDWWDELKVKVVEPVEF